MSTDDAALWQNGTITDLGTLSGPGGGGTFAFAISNSGRVAGTSFTAAGEQHAFMWQNGTMTDLGTLGGGNSIASAINNAGQVVGQSGNHAVLWE